MASSQPACIRQDGPPVFGVWEQCVWERIDGAVCQSALRRRNSKYRAEYCHRSSILSIGRTLVFLFCWMSDINAGQCSLRGTRPGGFWTPCSTLCAHSSRPFGTLSRNSRQHRLNCPWQALAGEDCILGAHRARVRRGPRRGFPWRFGLGWVRVRWEGECTVVGDGFGGGGVWIAQFRLCVRGWCWLHGGG